MAVFRKVHVSFWSDSWISSLTVEQRYFYLYILTNEKTTQCGIYEITKKQIAFDTGYSIDRVSILLKFFEKEGKLRFNSETNELAVKNWVKYNGSTSPQVKTCVDKELKQVKDTLLILYINSIDTPAQEEEEREEEQEGEIDTKKLSPKSFYLSEIETNKGHEFIEGYREIYFVMFEGELKNTFSEVVKIKEQISFKNYLVLKEKEKECRVTVIEKLFI